LVSRFNPGASEVGNQIIFSSTPQALTYFSFEFYAINNDHSTFLSSSTIDAEVRFYENSGPGTFNGYYTPNNMFYDSGLFSVSDLLLGSPTTPTDRDTITFNTTDFGAMVTPAGLSEMTWSVQFSGLGAGDEVGLDLYGPPVVGGNHGDYWLWNGTSWELDDFVPSQPAGTGAASLMEASLVPEPSVFALASFGGLGFLAFLRRFRRNR
jgi:hypothetical protein